MRTLQSWISAGALVGAIACLPCAARAGDGAETMAMTDKARQLYEEGVAALKRSKFFEARASFLAAWSLKKHWQIAANLADCELELGKFREAAEHAHYYRKNAPADRHPKGDALLARAKEKVGTLTIEVDKAGAEVLLDDVVLGKAPLEDVVFVEPGSHRVTARMAGSPDVSQSLAIKAGGAHVAELKLATSSPPPPPPTAKGPNVIVLATGGSLAGAALIAGIALTVVANGKAADAKSMYGSVVAQGGASACTSLAAPGCQSLHDTLEAKQNLSSGAAWSFIGAGVFAAATVTYGLVTRAKTTTSGFAVAPVITSAQRGVVVQGAF